MIAVCKARRECILGGGSNKDKANSLRYEANNLMVAVTFLRVICIETLLNH
jgi:hypothetical protein